MRRKIMTTFFLILVVMFSCSLLACKDKTEQSFNVSFYSETGELVTTVNTGDKDKLNSELLSNVTKADTEKYEYKFVGWYTSAEGGKVVKSLSDIDEETDLYPRFEEVLKRYDVRFYNADGSLIFTANVGYGSPATFLGATPEKQATNEYTYHFVDWDAETTYVTSDLDVYPIFEAQTRYYEISFIGYDGAILQSGLYVYDEVVSFDGEIPVKPETESLRYDFIGWDSQVTNAREEKFYTAVYVEVIKQFLVDFYVNDELFVSKIVNYGESLTDIPEVPELIGFDSEWDRSEYKNITKNIRVDAVYVPKKYTVSFDMAGATTDNCSSLVLLYGDEYQLPEYNGFKFGYKFIGWESEGQFYEPGRMFTISNFDVTYTAKWEQVKYSLYYGSQNMNDFINDCKIYLFETNEIFVVSKTYKVNTGIQISGYYNVAVVRGCYEFINGQLEVQLLENYNFSYNSESQPKANFDYSKYSDKAVLQVSNLGDSLISEGVEYKLYASDLYVENEILSKRQILGVVLDRNAVFVQDSEFVFNYAVAIYSDLTFEVLNNVEIENISTAAVGNGNFEVFIDNSKFVFDYNVISLEDSQKVDYIDVSGDLLYSVGASLGQYFFNIQYYGGYRSESYVVDKTCISGFDTTTRGVKTLTFTLEEGVFTLEIYVVDGIDDVLYFESYCDSNIMDVRQSGYNVFIQGETIDKLGVKYGSCSVGYFKSVNGAEIVDSFVIKEVDVSLLNLSTEQCGYFTAEINIDGKIVRVDYVVLDEYSYNLLDEYELILENGPMFVIGDNVEYKIRASYSNGQRYEYFNIEDLENAEIRGLDTENSGIFNIYLLIDGLVVSSKQIIVFENEESEIVVKKFVEDYNGNYLYENVFTIGQEVSKLAVKYIQTIYSYKDGNSTFIEGVEYFDCGVIDTSVEGLKSINLVIDGITYIANYLVVAEEDYLEVADFTILGDVDYLVGESVDLELELTYGDNYKKEVVAADAYIAKYDNTQVGAKVLEIKYKNISKKFLVYFYSSIYGYVDYFYYKDFILEDMEYRNLNVFYKGQVVTEVAINQINARRYYNGDLSVEESVVKYKLQNVLDTSILGDLQLQVSSLVSDVVIDYSVVSRTNYYDETGYNIVGSRVIKPQDKINLKLVVEFANGLRHEVVKITEEDLPSYSRQSLGQQALDFNYNNKDYSFALFNYNPETDQIEFFAEYVFFDTSLKDYHNTVLKGEKEADFSVKCIINIYNLNGELVERNDEFFTIHVTLNSSLSQGVHIVEVRVFGKAYNIQYVVL